MATSASESIRSANAAVLGSLPFDDADDFEDARRGFLLRHGSFGAPAATGASDLIGALSPSQLFDAIAIRVDGPRAWNLTLSIGVVLADANKSYRLDLRNGVLVHREAPVDGVDLEIRTSLAALPGLLVGQTTGMTLEGDAAVLARLAAVLEAPDPGFAIVTP